MTLPSYKWDSKSALSVSRERKSRKQRAALTASTVKSTAVNRRRKVIDIQYS